MKLLRSILAIVVFLPLILADGSDNMATVVKQILTPDGVTFNLNSSTYEVYGLTELGPPQVKLFTHRVPGQPGMVLDNILDEPRTFTISHVALGVADIEGGLAAMNDVLTNYRYNRTATIQPLRLRVTVGGVAAEIFCYYGGSIVKTVDNRHILFGFTLIAPDPYWYATTETSVTDIGADSLAVSYILGKVDGAWTAMGNNGTGTVRAIIVDDEDNLYIGSTGVNWAGIDEADRIAKWTKSTTTWSALDDGGNDSVYSLALGPDGLLYAGGAFTSMSAVGDTDGIAVWNGTAWAAMDTGTDGNAPVYAMVMDSQGNLYAGGSFATMSGVADTAYVAKWDGSAWSTLDVGLDDNVWGLAVDANDDVYVVGQFTDVAGGGGGTYNRIIKWDSSASAWVALGTGLNGIAYDVDIDDDGIVYVCGAFTTADGVTVNYIAKWNGQTFEAMDAGLNATAWWLDISPSGNVFTSGDFTTAGSDSLAVNYIAQWNGAQWNRIECTLPGTPTVHSFAWDSDENFYLGFDSTGEAVLSKIQDATNGGNKPFPPTIDVGGPGTLVSIRNETTLQEIPFDLYINDGETVTVDLGDPGAIPGGIQITSDWAGRPNKNNLLGKARAPSSLALFELVPDPEAASGVNKIGVFVTGQPAEAGDGGNILSRWSGITGIDTTNSDDGRLYVQLSVETDGDEACSALFYKDSAFASLVAQADLSTTTTGSRTVNARNASGLGGTIYQDTALGLGAELVQNPGFETAGGGGADIWANWTEAASDGALANDVGTVHGGVDSNKTTAGATKDTLVNQAVVTTAAKIYEISFWSYGDGINDGRYIVYDESNAADIIALAATGDTAAAWAQLGPIYVIAPTGCVSMGIYLQCADLDTAVTYFDDVSIKEVTLAPDSDITADYSLVTIKHWDRYDSLAAAVDD